MLSFWMMSSAHVDITKAAAASLPPLPPSSADQTDLLKDEAGEAAVRLPLPRDRPASPLVPFNRPTFS